MNLENILLPARTGDRRLPLHMARMLHAQSRQNGGPKALSGCFRAEGGKRTGGRGPFLPLLLLDKALYNPG